MIEYNGILNINKPEGITSQTAVTRVKRILGVKKAGHCGTLDPLASGVLPVMVGSAVKVSDWLTGHDKRYLAGIELGLETDSEDITGAVTARYEGALPSFEELREATLSFTGKIKQIPPMYSAIKKDGTKLYDLARKGVVIEREAREIEIYSIDAIDKDGKYYLDVSCSKGTYIRTLCANIGKTLGCGAVMSSLCRTAVGSYHIADSMSINDLESLSSDEINRLLITAESVFLDLDKIVLPPFFEHLFRNGAPVSAHKIGINNHKENGLYRIYGSNGFFALGEAQIFDGISVIKVKKFF
jgi:tRNA pseudouridine55 synthase